MPYGYIRLLANSVKLFTKNMRKNMMASRTSIGEKSMPPKARGNLLRIGYSKGSVTL
jgi:hypothetical protein